MTDTQGVTLRDNDSFPLAVAKDDGVPNLARIAGREAGRFAFGITPEGTAVALRLLADQLEAGVVIPQEMADATKAVVGDFTLRTMTFTFADRPTPEN